MKERAKSKDLGFRTGTGRKHACNQSQGVNEPGMPLAMFMVTHLSFCQTNDQHASRGLSCDCL